MEYRMKGSVTLADEDFEVLSQQPVIGQYPGEPGKWIVRLTHVCLIPEHKVTETLSDRRGAVR